MSNNPVRQNQQASSSAIIILVSTLLSNRKSHNGFLIFYVISTYFNSGLISLTYPVVAVVKGDHHM
jgi:hypothetical protein